MARSLAAGVLVAVTYVWSARSARRRPPAEPSAHEYQESLAPLASRFGSSEHRSNKYRWVLRLGTIGSLMCLAFLVVLPTQKPPLSVPSDPPTLSLEAARAIPIQLRTTYQTSDWSLHFQLTIPPFIDGTTNMRILLAGGLRIEGFRYLPEHGADEHADTQLFTVDRSTGPEVQVVEMTVYQGRDGDIRPQEFSARIKGGKPFVTRMV